MSEEDDDDDEKFRVDEIIECEDETYSNEPLPARVLMIEGDELWVELLHNVVNMPPAQFWIHKSRCRKKGPNTKWAE